MSLFSRKNLLSSLIVTSLLTFSSLSSASTNGTKTPPLMSTNGTKTPPLMSTNGTKTPPWIWSLNSKMSVFERDNA